MIYGSVCSGIEAATVAWHGLGWRAAFFSEIEAFPRAVLTHHYGCGSPNGVPLHGDFTTIQDGEYEPIELLVGGTPCQDFSIAGLRAGIAGDRGNLTLEFVRLAARLRPRWIVWENVPGILSSDGGRAFGAFLGGLAHVGYGFAYRILDAQFAGLAQRRERVFVVGYLGDWRRAAAVLFEQEGLRWNPPPSRSERQGIAGTITPGAHPGSYNGQDAHTGHLVAGTLSARQSAGGGLGTDFDLSGGLTVAFGGNNTTGPIDISTALNSHGGPHGRLDFESETFIAHAGVVAPPLTHNPYGDHESREGLLIAHSLRGEGFDASEDGTGRGIPLVTTYAYTLEARTQTQAIASDTYNQAVSGDLTQTLCSRGDSPGGNSHLVPAIAFSSKDHGSDASDDLAPTMRAMGHAKSHANAGGQLPVALNLRGREGGSQLEEADVASLRSASGGSSRSYVSQSAVRRLMPVECERLQGFSDGYTDVPYRGKQAADGPRYKALGNSMAVPCMRWIGERIAMVEKLIGSRPDAT